MRLAFIIETDRDAHVRFTFYFQDREPMTAIPAWCLPAGSSMPGST